jgi:hypothetical protein
MECIPGHRSSERRRGCLGIVALAFAAVGSAASCKSPIVASRLDLTVDIDPALELDNIEITITGGGRSDFVRKFPVSVPMGTPVTVPPINWQIVIPNVRSSFVAAIEVKGTKTGEELVRIDADATILIDGRVAAVLTLSSACRKVICDDPARTCLNGICQPKPTYGQMDAGTTPDVSAAPDAVNDLAAEAVRDTATDILGTDTSRSDGGDGRPPGVNGDTCSVGTDCATGNCVESVCCDKPCTDTCYSCKNALTGSAANGTCAVIASGLDDTKGRCGAATVTATCGNTSHCNGMGACEKYGSTTVCLPAACAGGSFTPASTCNGLGDCMAGTARSCMGFACTTTAGCATTCTTDLDCAGGYCGTAVPRTCIAKKVDGAPCLMNNECVNSQCVGSVCCQSSCTGLCLSCALADTNQQSGLCKPIKAGGGSKGGCAIDTTACGHDGTCDGTGACRYQVASTSCRAATCMTGTATNGANCDGVGNCPGAVQTPCNPYICGSNACLTDCTSNAQCVAGSACLVGHCAVCTGGLTVCPNACVNLGNDANNCGVCGHSCLGGNCSNATCLPVRLATISSRISSLAVNSTTVFAFVGTPDTSRLSVYRIGKTAQNVTPAAIATVTPGTQTSGYMGATDTLLIWEAFTGNQGGKFSTVYSCDPRNCQGTLQTWFDVVNTQIGCDPAAQKCFIQAAGSHEIKVAILGGASQTAPQAFAPALTLASGGGLTAAGGSLFAVGTDVQLTIPVLDRVPEDASAAKARLANFSAAATTNSLFGPIIATSSQVFFVGQTTDTTAASTIGLMSVALPFGVGDRSPSFLPGTTMPSSQFRTYWADDVAIFFIDSASQFVTCPASGCVGAAKPLADAANSEGVPVGDSQALYWIDDLTIDSGIVTSSVIMKVAR